MADYVLGIDPGAHGGLALYNCQQAKIIELWDTPNIEVHQTNGKLTHKVDVKKLMLLFERAVGHLTLDDSFYIHIERVAAHAKQSAPAAFNFGYAAASPAILAELLGYEPLMIPPQVWKRQYGLQGTEKDESRQLVINLFPYLANQLKRKKDVDKADAVLIACYRP